MRPGNDGELIFEGGTEAKIAAHLLSAHYKDGVRAIYPTIEEEYVYYGYFVTWLFEDKIGTGDTRDYVISDPRMAKGAVRALERAIYAYSSRLPYRLSREAFIARRLDVYKQRLPQQTDVIEAVSPDNVATSAGKDSLENLINRYCEERGLDPSYIDVGDLAVIMESAKQNNAQPPA